VNRRCAGRQQLSESARAVLDGHLKACSWFPSTAALPDLTIAPTGELLSSGERVYWKWLMSATHEGEFAGVPATGKRFELRGLTLLLTRSDEIVRGADCFDVASFVRQVAPDRGRRSNSSSRSTPDPWMCILADEDNIGYGE